VSEVALPRRLLAEYLGSAVLVTAVVGSGIMAARLSPGDVGLQLLENALATMLALAVLILVLGPVSGAHLNPVVTVVDWWLRRRDAAAPAPAALAGYVLAQLLGAISGAVLANVMFGLAPVSWSATDRDAPHLWIGETVATAGLILLVFSLVRTRNTRHSPAAVGAYIGAAYWFTSSTSFANPAVTIGRGFTDTFAGIAPASMLGFIVAQLVGGALGAVLAVILYPRPPAPAAVDPSAAERLPMGNLR
jgi:glycerol uptake facilitator-like aquaporin